MRILIQRVLEASVTVEGELVGKIGQGLLVLAGFHVDDTADDLDYCARKLCALRIFNDATGVMNLSVREVAGELLIVSQFTLLAETKKGNRPSYIQAARPDAGHALYEQFLERATEELADPQGRPIQGGRFGADMKVALVNDGPVTIWIDSRAR